MCGFVALFDRDRVFAPALLARMEQDIVHRGPDSGGQMSEPGAAFVFRRLAIIDPTAKSDQPMEDHDSGCTLIFNGEIYNFKALREELQRLGRPLRTNGDTETILQGYLQWGDAVTDRLEGMFAFVLIDRRNRKVIAARDTFGIKPLYMTRRNGLTTFSSEMRPLARLVPPEPDPQALAELLMFRFAAGRLSNLRAIDKVPGGSLVTLSLDDGTCSERRFSDPLATFEPDDGMTRETALADAEDAIVNSVTAHLQSDVGYTVQLSGGVDSSLVAALAQRTANARVKSFGIRLDDPQYDESEFRSAVARHCGLDHHEVRLTGVDFAEALPRAVKHMEGPVPHFGCVMLMLLCDQIRQVSKVVLTGEGADEMFGGYKRYDLWRKLRQKQRIANLVPSGMWPLLRRYREIERYANRDASIYAAVHHDFVALNQVFPDLIAVPGARDAAAARFDDFRSRMFAADQTTYLESLLMRQDKMAMAASVEARVPFTHLPLARVVNRIPHRLRAPGGDTKPLLKQIAERYLPREVVYRRKIGLGLPLDRWATEPNSLGRYIGDLLDSRSALATFADRKRLTKVVNDFRDGMRQGLPPIPHLINMELWLRSLSQDAPALSKVV